MPTLWTCDYGHEQIGHIDMPCPLCEQIKDHETEVTELNDRIAELEADLDKATDAE